MSLMIALKGLTRRFGRLLAVDGVSLSVGRGEVLAFLGPNGAGKSTTMKMVTGFIAPTAGTAEVCGFDVVERPIEVKRRIGYLPEGAPTYGDMTPAAFLDFIAAVRGLSGADRRRRIAEVVERVSLGEVLHQPIDTLSKGFKRRVGLAQAILHDPEVLILDEPTDGLDPNQKHHVRGLIRDMAADKAIIISTHILEEVEAVCSRAVIIARGRVLADGTAEDLLARLPAHNAVTLTVPAAAAKPVTAALAALDGVATVERLEETRGRVRLRVLPSRGTGAGAGPDGRPLALAVAEAVNARGVTVEELGVDRGRLDDVFRDITTGTSTPTGAPGTTEAAHV